LRSLLTVREFSAADKSQSMIWVKSQNAAMPVWLAWHN
jgi:hypothetical protein